MVVVIIVVLVVKKSGSCCFCCVGPVTAFFIPQLPPIVSDDPLGMRGLHTAVCSAALTGWLSNQVFFSVTHVTFCTECSVAPTVAAPQTGFSVTCVTVLHTWRPILIDSDCDHGFSWNSTPGVL